MIYDLDSYNRINAVLTKEWVYYMLDSNQLFVGTAHEFCNIQLRHKQILGFYLNYVLIGAL